MSNHQPATPTLITPECAMPGCSEDGDQFTMVRCRACGAWYCPDHIQQDAGVRMLPLQSAQVAKSGSLSHYVGLCVRCHQAQQRLRH
jgi:hypothetical protein